MIKKTDSSLLNWIYKHVVDFTLEDDDSGLSWESTNREALSFINCIPMKEKVQKYGIYAGRSYLFAVEEFDDIKEGLKAGVISKKTCRRIYTWNSEIGRENWNMDDVKMALYPPFGKPVRRNYLYTALKELVDLEVIECLTPERKTGRVYRVTEKGDMVLLEIK